VFYFFKVLNVKFWKVIDFLQSKLKIDTEYFKVPSDRFISGYIFFHGFFHCLFPTDHSFSYLVAWKGVIVKLNNSSPKIYYYFLSLVFHNLHQFFLPPKLHIVSPPLRMKIHHNLIGKFSAFYGINHLKR
jgi:hypothetical protein